MLRIALREATTRDDLDDVTREAGLLLLNIVPATATHPAQIIYTTRDRQSLIHLIDDARLGVLYFALHGAEEDAIARVIRERLPTLAQEEVFALAGAAAPRDAIRGIALIAITAGPTAEPAPLEIFRAALVHADPDVRSAARSAAEYVPWPELKEAAVLAAMLSG